MIIELVTVAFDQLRREIGSQDPLEPGRLGEVALEQLRCVGDLGVRQQHGQLWRGQPVFRCGAFVQFFVVGQEFQGPVQVALSF